MICGSPTTTSVLVTNSPTLPAWPVFRNVDALQRGIIANRVRRVSMRHLEPDGAGVEVDRRQHAVGRLQDRQALQPGGQSAAASTPTSCCRRRCAGSRSRLSSRGCRSAPPARSCRSPSPTARATATAARIPLPDRNPFLRLRFGIHHRQIRFADRLGGHRRIIRLAVKDSRLRIERRARPIDAAHRVADVDRAQPLLAGHGRRNERRRLPAIALQVLDAPVDAIQA